MAVRLPPNLHSLYMGGMFPLGVECRGCGHKALVPAERFGGCKGDMTELRRLRLACTACGSRDFQSTVFLREGHAEAWLEGLTVSPIDGSQPTSIRRRCRRGSWAATASCRATDT